MFKFLRIFGLEDGELEPRDPLELELDELDLERDRDGDLLDVLPDGEGVLEPERDFFNFVFWIISLDIRRSDGSIEVET